VSLLILVCPLTEAAPGPAIRDAWDTQAGRLLQECSGATEALRLDRPDALVSLDGKSCRDVPGLTLVGPDTPMSVITLRPGTREGVQIEVTSRSGQVFRTLPQKTERSEEAPTGPALSWWVRAVLCGVGLALLVAVVAVLPGHPALTWAGLALLLPGLGLLWAFSRHPPTDDGPAQVTWLLADHLIWWLLLALSAGLTRHRNVATESWAASFGAALVWSMPLSPALVLAVLTTFRQETTPEAATVSLILLTAASLLRLWTRLKPAPTQPLP